MFLFLTFFELRRVRALATDWIFGTSCISELQLHNSKDRNLRSAINFNNPTPWTTPCIYYFAIVTIIKDCCTTHQTMLLLLFALALRSFVRLVQHNLAYVHQCVKPYLSFVLTQCAPSNVRSDVCKRVCLIDEISYIDVNYMLKFCNKPTYGKWVVFMGDPQRLISVGSRAHQVAESIRWNPFKVMAALQWLHRNHYYYQDMLVRGGPFDTMITTYRHSERQGRGTIHCHLIATPGCGKRKSMCHVTSQMLFVSAADTDCFSDSITT